MKFDTFCLNVSDKINAVISFIVSKLCFAEDKLNSKNNLNKFLICIIAAVSFAMMFYMNIKTPMAADDFAYHYIFGNGSLETTSQRVSSISDIITSMTAHYNWTNGRVITHFIVQLMILIGKPVFNVINALVYVVLTVLIYFHCVGKKAEKHSAVLFVAINLSIWSFAKQWGFSTVWLTGSINYMWATTIRLAALLPFRFYAEDGKNSHPVLKAFLMLFAGVLAGGTSENMSAVFIGIVVLYMIYYRIKHYKFRPFFITALVGALPGYAFMMLAPGNRVRTDIVSGEERNTFLYRFVSIPGNAVLYLSALAAALLIFALLLWKKTKNGKLKFFNSIIFFLGAAAGAGVMLFSPSFPIHAWFGIIIALIVAVGSFVIQIDILNVNYRRIFTVIVCFWSVFCAMQFYISSRETAVYYNKYLQREAYIEEQKDLGNYDICLEKIPAKNEHMPLYQVSDISVDKDMWKNTSKAKYYGLNSITRTLVEEE